MIAVFTKSRIRFKVFKFMPKNMFIRITKIDDIKGRIFIGVISERGWNSFKNEEMREAYGELKFQQPEIFK